MKHILAVCICLTCSTWSHGQDCTGTIARLNPYQGAAFTISDTQQKEVSGDNAGTFGTAVKYDFKYTVSKKTFTYSVLLPQRLKGRIKNGDLIAWIPSAKGIQNNYNEPRFNAFVYSLKDCSGIRLDDWSIPAEKIPIS